MESSAWKDHKNGYSYAKWNELSEKEPATTDLLKQEAGARVETSEFIYYVNYHEIYGWSVGRKNKNNPEQQLQHKQNSQGSSSASIQSELQDLRQHFTAIADTLEQNLGQISETLHRLDKKIDQMLTTTITTMEQGERSE